MKPQRSPASPRAREVRAIDAIARDLPSPAVRGCSAASTSTIRTSLGARGWPALSARFEALAARPGLAATAPR
ncbi:MAG: hypothetical protein ICV73_25610 [Acetobacteraceae bacterium]|nr:hypothetical protein [Acetobacteraceae bacterium]